MPENSTFASQGISLPIGCGTTIYGSIVLEKRMPIVLKNYRSYIAEPMV